MSVILSIPTALVQGETINQKILLLWTRNQSPLSSHPTTILCYRLPLLAQAALLLIWIILVLRRRADPTAAAVATVLLQVSMWNCRNVDFIVSDDNKKTMDVKLSQSLIECFVPFITCLMCVCYTHSHVKELTVSCMSWPSAKWKPALTVATWRTLWIAWCPLQTKPALLSG